jgi:hypothetical protein
MVVAAKFVTVRSASALCGVSEFRWWWWWWW